MKCFDVDETCNFEPKAKTPSLLFVHNEAFLSRRRKTPSPLLFAETLFLYPKDLPLFEWYDDDPIYV
jgi:hypothetical protein